MIRAAVTPAHTYDVTSTADAGTGTLRDALAKAATDKTYDKIVLKAGHYTLSSDQLVADDPAGIDIAGAGSTTTIIAQTGAFRVLQVIDGTPLTMSGVTLTGGHASTSAGDGDGGGIEIADGFLKLTSSTVYNNTADNYGGGIDIVGPSSSSVQSSAADLEHDNIKDNHAAYSGGINDQGQLLADYLTVTDNVASSEGGGIGLPWDNNIQASLDGSHLTISGNSASDGGGVYAEGYVSLSSSTIGGSTAAAGNTASSEGGGFWDEYGVDDFNGVTISNNTAPGEDGGGLYQEYGVDTFTGGSIVSNGAAYGAGVYQDDYSTLRTTGTHIDKNVATVEGGGFYSDTSTTVLTKSTLSNNTAEPTGSPVTYTGSGGGAYLSYGTDLTLSGSTMASNQAEWGGGIYADENSGVHFNGATVKDNNNANKSTTGGGGALYAYEENNITSSGSTFSGNFAQSGGAIYLDDEEDPVTIDASKFTGNTAVGDSALGGAIYEDSDSPLVIDNSVISGNVAGSSLVGNAWGGGLYVDNGPARLGNVTISGNHADFGAGAASEDDGLIVAVDSTITGNNAHVAGGGGISDDDSQFTLRESTVMNNTVAGASPDGLFGAGLAASGSSGIDAVNSTIADNHAETNGVASYGGGLEVEANGLASLHNTTVAANTSQTGHAGSAIAYGAGGQVQLIGSIVSGAGTTCSAAFSTGTGRLVSSGYNVASDTSCGLKAVGDRQGVATKLGTLGKHGGPTATVPLLAGSPAINNDGGCPLPATDQRGVPRAAGSCDSGSYEYTPGHVSSVTPHKGKAGTKVRISGSGFYFVSKVTFGSHRAHILSKSATRIVVRAPKGPKGLTKHARKVAVRVFTVDGSSGIGHFTYVKLHAKKHHHKKH